MIVALTGGTGFLGSWILRILSECEEAKVDALTRIDSKFDRLQGIKNLTIHRVLEKDFQEYIHENTPDILIFNDWWGVENKFRNASEQWENVERIKKRLDLIRASSVKCVIGVGSQAELGPVSEEISENLEDNPTSVYGEAKVETRKILESFARANGMRFVWMRIFSTYGALDADSWLIPKIIDYISNGKSFPLTKGEQEWNYLHAFDLARAFQTVIQNPGLSGIVNVGNPETVLVRDVALFIANWFAKPQLLNFGALPYAQDQVMRLKPSVESLKSVNWEPQVNLEQGLEHTINWFLRKPDAPLKLKNGSMITLNLPMRS
jgi:UDP-glucose 4-epimerase